MYTFTWQFKNQKRATVFVVRSEKYEKYFRKRTKYCRDSSELSAGVTVPVYIIAVGILSTIVSGLISVVFFSDSFSANKKRVHYLLLYCLFYSFYLCLPSQYCSVA